MTTVWPFWVRGVKSFTELNCISENLRSCWTKHLFLFEIVPLCTTSSPLHFPPSSAIMVLPHGHHGHPSLPSVISGSQSTPVASASSSSTKTTTTAPKNNNNNSTKNNNNNNSSNKNNNNNQYHQHRNTSDNKTINGTNTTSVINRDLWCDSVGSQGTRKLEHRRGS